MRALFAAAVALTFALTPAWATAQTPERRSVNDRLFRNIQTQVLQYPHYTVFDSISAQIDQEGVVTLTGKVTMPYKREDIGKRVSGVAGVRQVNNRIDVLPASKSDDELRQGIARAIYNNPTFRPYASRVNPPIHVIVERGRVTLEGTVTDESERLLAKSIARSFVDAFVVNDALMTEAEARSAILQNGFGRR
jgi:hyperosmotically inducible periplasmic protein